MRAPVLLKVLIGELIAFSTDGKQCFPMQQDSSCPRAQACVAEARLLRLQLEQVVHATARAGAAAAAEV